MVCMFCCMQPKNLFRDSKQWSLLRMVLSLSKMSAYGNQALMGVFKITGQCDCWAFLCPCGYLCLTVNWRKDRMGFWTECRLNTWSIPETSGNDLDSIGFWYRPGVWMQARPANTLCFITQPLTKQTVHHSNVKLWSLGFVKHWEQGFCSCIRCGSLPGLYFKRRWNAESGPATELQVLLLLGVK